LFLFIVVCVLHSEINDMLMMLVMVEKATWAGCGAHVPRVMDPIPEEDWCVVCFSLLRFSFFIGGER
jgi:hypothetical protein